MSASTYPVRVDASLDSPLSRWLWLVKWVLVIPHYVVLSFLWLGFFFLSIGAFFAILFTGRYPRSIFDFNVGVLRWTWRVQYYAYGALGTDRYPPFSLGEEPGYPAHLEIEYPGQLSRGLVLVKWWLLAIPQYIIVGLFAGGGTWLALRHGGQGFIGAGGGLIGLLVLVAAIGLLFTGRYPQPIFDFVLGMNRWILRVAAYAGLMTDRYPPFRLDMGGSEPGGTLTLPPPGPPYVPADDAEVVAPLTGGPWAGAPMTETLPPAGPAAGRTGWRAGRVVSVVIGSILALTSVGLISGGGFLLWAGQTHRQDGYLTTTANTFSTGGYALASNAFNLPSQTSGAFASLVGKIRIRATAPNPAQPIFIGIAPAAAVSRYLTGVPYTTVSGFHSRAGQRTTSYLGTAAPVPPAGLAIWTARASGTGTRSIVWTPRSGNWTVVVMNPDASRGVTARTDVGAAIPGLPWIVTGLLAGGLLLAIAGIVLIVVPIRRVSVETAG
jgi:hypothetical protein